MATLEGKKIIIIGGSSGIGYSVAKASLLSDAEHVLIASSTKEKVDNAVAKLLEENQLQGLASLNGRLSGDVLDLTKSKDISAFFERVGEFDHLIITSGDISLQFNFKEVDLDKCRGQSTRAWRDVRFLLEHLAMEQGYEEGS